MHPTNATRRSTATGLTLLAALVAAALIAMSAGLGRRAVAHAEPVPTGISVASSAKDVMRFAEASGSRWGTIAARGHTRSGASSRPFALWIDKKGRTRTEDGDDIRVRNGDDRTRADRRTGEVRRFSLPRPDPGADRAMKARMAAHRANDPTLSRDGEVLVDTPLNDLVSPARIIRKELGMAAVSVRNAGPARVAGRDAVVLEARFPAELAKEDHWDVYVDVETGVLLGLVIEPLEGGDRYECLIDSLDVDPALDDALFERGADPTVP